MKDKDLIFAFDAASLNNAQEWVEVAVWPKRKH
jgi:hypothetical protein